MKSKRPRHIFTSAAASRGRAWRMMVVLAAIVVLALAAGIAILASIQLIRT